MSYFQIFAIVLSLLYLCSLFGIAYYIELRESLKKKIRESSWIYALTLSIYCTAWTYYGSIGLASRGGLHFLSIYLGPTLCMPFWYVISKKMIRITKMQNISSFADFISIRFSHSTNLGMFITILTILGIVPYISLQVKAISESFDLLLHFTNDTNELSIQWIPAVIVVLIGLFILLFASNKMDTNEHHTGVVASIAFESVFKLLAFLIAGVFIVLIVYDHPKELYESISSHSLSHLLTFTDNQSTSYSDWGGLIVLSGIAILLLPRQFQVAIIENHNEEHLKKAVWSFPLYLLLFNLFVIPVAFAGNMLMPDSNSEYYIMSLPLEQGYQYLSILIFLGGFSAAAAMMVIETVALSNMLSNNFAIPLLLKLNQKIPKFSDDLAKRTLLIRHLSVFIILFLTLLYHYTISSNYSLVSIGLISFVFIAQFFPTFIGALYIKRVNHLAVWGSLMVGFVIWFYTLIFPSILSQSDTGIEILSHGPMGIQWLRPNSLLGLDTLSPVMHSFFWSMLCNVGCFVLLNIVLSPSKYEKQMAHIYVDVYKYSSFDDSQIIWRETAAYSDIQNLLEKFMGTDKARLALNSFAIRYQVSEDNLSKDARLIPFAERLLSKIVGSVSARILLETIIKDKEINYNEMLDMLQESKEVHQLNRELSKKSNELEKAKQELEKTNNHLLLLTEVKDEFLATVSHELKSPLTSIASFSEILKDPQDLSPEEISKFSGIINKETARITRLVNQLLDLEKYDSGKQKLYLSIVNIYDFIDDLKNVVKAEIEEKSCKLEVTVSENINEVIFDKDKMLQVMINIVSNAIKFSPPNGIVKLECYIDRQTLFMEVSDQGKGIAPEYHEMIFEKFFQAKNQSMQKPKGSGLGLAIAKKIVSLHNGTIIVKKSNEQGTTFELQLPIMDKTNE